MTAINEKSTPRPSVDSPIAALWHEAAPRHFDLAVPSWAKATLVIVATLVALHWLDLPIAHWALLKHPIPDLANPNAQHNDIARELMMLEQWGQWVCSVLVIVAVAMIDRAGPRRALSIAMGCLVTVFVCYVLKDLIGRSRPPVVGDGSWIWGGPAQGFRNGSPWGSFPSAHTTGAVRTLRRTLLVLSPRPRPLHGHRRHHRDSASPPRGSLCLRRRRRHGYRRLLRPLHSPRKTRRTHHRHHAPPHPRLVPAREWTGLSAEECGGGDFVSILSPHKIFTFPLDFAQT